MWAGLAAFTTHGIDGSARPVLHGYGPPGKHGENQVLPTNARRAALHSTGNCISTENLLKIN
jgi:hypothetical protein